MRFAQAWLVASHDFRAIRQRRSILYALVAFPLAVSIGFPILIDYILHHAGAAGPPSTYLPGFIDAFSFWYVIGASTLPITIASYSIVGEKLEKSLEPLLATPTTDSEILVGKAMAAFLPTMTGIWGGAVLFMVLVDRGTRAALGGYYFPNAEMGVILLFLAPLTALVSIELSIIVSAWANDVRSVQQLGGLLFLPFILLYVFSEAGVFVLDTTHLLEIGGVFLVMLLALFSVSRRTFHRESILTRWK